MSLAPLEEDEPLPDAPANEGDRGSRALPDAAATWLQLALIEERQAIERLLRGHDDLLSKLQKESEYSGICTYPSVFKGCSFLENEKVAAQRLQLKGCSSKVAAAEEAQISRPSATPASSAKSFHRAFTEYVHQSDKTPPASEQSAVPERGTSRPSMELSMGQAITVGRRLSIALQAMPADLKSRTPKVTLALDHALDMVSGLVICLNVIMMAVNMEYNGVRLRWALLHVEGFEGSKPAEEVWPHADIVFEGLEWAFGSFFILELAVRVVYRIRLRLDWVWNTVDVLIIAAWMIERIDSSAIESDFNPTVLRLCRLIRLMRLVKLIRHLHMFDALHLIVKSIQSSMSVLTWTVVLLMLFMMVVAMVNSSFLESFILDPQQDGHARAEVFMAWGSFVRAYVSMFEITLANWGPQCWLLMNLVDEKWGFFFIVWRCCFGFAVIQVITSVFIQHTFKVASRDADVMIAEKKKASEAYLKHLDSLFTRLDTSGDGHICWEEFEAALATPQVKHWFGALDIDVSDLSKLFYMLDDGSGHISKEEFIFGLKKVKGNAQSIDLLLLMKQVQLLVQSAGLEKSKSFVLPPSIE